MILNDIVEEILEKVGDGTGLNISMRSIIRKVDSKQREILRQYGNNNDDIAVMDLLAGVVEYPLPCAPGNITSVYVNNQRIPFRQRNDYKLTTYYYLMDGTIGLFFPGGPPKDTLQQGLKITHKHVPTKLTVNDLNAEPELEEDYRMLLVYGVLIDIAEPGMMMKYESAYRSLLSEYVRSTRDPETTTISGVFSI